MFYQNEEKSLNQNEIQVGVDEAGRGNLFGSIFAGAVILPLSLNPNDVNVMAIKDSKKLSGIKRKRLAQWIKENAVAWNVASCYASEIDANGIEQCNMEVMHKALTEVWKMQQFDRILVDGARFRPWNNKQNIPHVCIPQGDNKYLAIASASILAKEAQCEFIARLCREHPDIDRKYGLLSNNGYGTRKHIEGIKEYGYTEWHRRSYHIKSLALT